MDLHAPPSPGSTPVRIRPAAPEDVPGVLPMVQSVCDFHQRLDPRRFDFVADIAARYARWLPQRATDPESVFLVAEAPGTEPGRTLAGFLVAQVMESIPIYRTTRYAWVHDLWIEPAFRGAGLGGALVDAAVERFRAMGVAQIRGETAWANETARRMLARRGFRPSTAEVLLDLASPGSGAASGSKAR